MNIIVISEENKILHIVNFGYQAEYTLYNSKGYYLFGGVLESVYDYFNDEKLTIEIINLIQQEIDFERPYIYLYGSNTVPLLRLIKYENSKKTSKKIVEYINSLGDKDDYFYFKERWQYV